MIDVLSNTQKTRENESAFESKLNWLKKMSLAEKYYSLSKMKITMFSPNFLIRTFSKFRFKFYRFNLGLVYLTLKILMIGLILKSI